MIVMPANACGIKVGYAAHRFERSPVRLGHLFSPGSERGPWPFMPYALDNGAFSCWVQKKPFDVVAWRELLDWASSHEQAPIWCLVPDVVGDQEATLRFWDQYAPEIEARGWPLAFAAQDGMKPADVPGGASVVFMGGAPQKNRADEWKWKSLETWCRAFRGRKQIHVGRANGLPALRECARLKVASCDGTGYSRTDRQWNELEGFLAEMSCAQTSLWSEPFAGTTALSSRSASTGELAPAGAGN